MNKIILYMISIFIFIGCCGNCGSTIDRYPSHSNITSTVFWAGEDADVDNHHISNFDSSWDNFWMEHFGGVDDPDDRNGSYPAAFMPLENPFYFALPYNDMDINGTRKASAFEHIYWTSEKAWNERESMCKNRWIKITKDGISAYAQWEDSGPFEYDDIDYVFGNKQPKNTINNSAGLDVSPAVRDYLNLQGIDTVEWQFVDEEDVPDGPWKNIITISDINWSI